MEAFCKDNKIFEIKEFFRCDYKLMYWLISKSSNSKFNKNILYIESQIKEMWNGEKRQHRYNVVNVIDAIFESEHNPYFSFTS